MGSLGLKKILLIGVGVLGSQFLSLPVLAIDEKGLIPQEGKNPKSKLKALGVSLLGLKIFYDPTATLVEKYVAAGKMGCCTSAIILGAASELSPPQSKLKIALIACCTASWAGYGILEMK